jgi:hypothetical protein
MLRQESRVHLRAKFAGRAQEGVAVPNGSLVWMERSTGIVAADSYRRLSAATAGSGSVAERTPENTGAPNLGGSHTRQEVSGKSPIKIFRGGLGG